MSMKLIVVLLVLMGVNQVIGTGCGIWREGFQKDLLKKGLWKIGCLALGYGTLAIAAKYASNYVPSAEYLSGILIEPIAKYFSKICESLRRLLDDSVTEVVEQKRQNE